MDKMKYYSETLRAIKMILCGCKLPLLATVYPCWKLTEIFYPAFYGFQERQGEVVDSSPVLMKSLKMTT